MSHFKPKDIEMKYAVNTSNVTISVCEFNKNRGKLFREDFRRKIHSPGFLCL